MATTLTTEDARQSLNAHVAAKGAELFAKYGPHIGWPELQAILQDHAFVRYPCELVFDSAPLQPGEFAYPEPKGETPEAGFTLYVHPVYMTELAKVPILALYQLVAVNYGAFASAEDAETFAAHALGLPQDEYYRIVCELADQLGAGAEPGLDAESAPSGCGGGGCGCSS